MDDAQKSLVKSVRSFVNILVPGLTKDDSAVFDPEAGTLTLRGSDIAELNLNQWPMTSGIPENFKLEKINDGAITPGFFNRSPQNSFLPLNEINYLREIQLLNV